MTDVLGATAGYIDSELSDYEPNEYQGSEYEGKYEGLDVKNYKKWDHRGDSSFNYFKRPSGGEDGHYNFLKAQNVSQDYSNHYTFRNRVLNSRRDDAHLLDTMPSDGYKYKDGLKSPRFGREDLNQTKLNSPNHSTPAKVGDYPLTKDREFLSNNLSFDTVDSLTPVTNLNQGEGEFKWWRDVESSPQDNSNAVKYEGVEGSNMDRTGVEVPENLVSLKGLKGPSRDWSTRPNKLTTLKNTSYSHDNKLDNYELKDVTPSGEEQWKSWTTGTDELQQLRTKLVQKLLNPMKVQGYTGEDGGLDNQDGESWDQLNYYKDMNKILFNKLLLLTNSSNKLEYNLNYQYISSIQNHLIKVHQYINNVVNPDMEPVKVDKTSDRLESNEESERLEVVREEFERLKLENAELKEKVTSLEKELRSWSSHEDNEGGDHLKSEKTAKSTPKGAEDPEKLELLEKIKVIQKSKDNLEEDFKKTLTYMRLMKDRLKLFKTNNSPNCNNHSVIKREVTSPIPSGNLVRHPLNGTAHSPVSKVNATVGSPMKNKRSNSCVRFNETSELYLVPRSLSENRTILINNNSNKFNKFFKIFSKN